jgi:hypothetical protein
MTDRDPPHDTSDGQRPTRRRRNGSRDCAGVAQDTAANALPGGTESSYGAASPDPAPVTPARATPDRDRALALELTTPEVVAITDEQYREAVDLLAAMIVCWVQRDRADQRDTTPQDQ